LIHFGLQPGFRKTRFLKSQTYWVFWFLLVWGFIGFLDFFLFEQAVGKLVDLAHHISFYLDLPVF